MHTGKQPVTEGGDEMAELEKVVLATHNTGKVRELAEPLRSLGVELLGLEAFPQVGEIVEDGATFAENALIKAATVADVTGLISIADDSGLEVDALDGRPGIYSARYADDLLPMEGESRDMRNIRKLLMELKDVPYERRQARFVCCMACVSPGLYEPEETLVVQGTWEGRILPSCIGSNGFGYDPVFADVVLGVTAAQLTREEKMARSHRGQAVQSLIACWPEWRASLPRK